MSQEQRGRNRPPTASPATTHTPSQRNPDTATGDNGASSGGITLHGWWKRLNRGTKVWVGGLATALTAIGAIQTGLLDPAMNQWTHRQPHYDEQALNCLRAGMQLPALEKCVHAGAQAVPRADATDHSGQPLTEGIYVLDTVYLQAFVDSNQSVQAYTITERAQNAPHGVRVLGHSYDFGHTTFADAPIQVAAVASVNGVHITAYYEISGTAEADLNQTIAIGSTDAGQFPAELKWPGPPPVVDGLALLPNSVSSDDKPLYTIEEHQVTTRLLDEAADYRTRAVINSVTVTAPDVDLAPEFLSLHPQETALLDPGST